MSQKFCATHENNGPNFNQVPFSLSCVFVDAINSFVLHSTVFHLHLGHNMSPWQGPNLRPPHPANVIILETKIHWAKEKLLTNSWTERGEMLTGGIVLDLKTDDENLLIKFLWEKILLKLKVKLNSFCLLHWQNQSFFLCIRSFLLFLLRPPTIFSENLDTQLSSPGP